MLCPLAHCIICIALHNMLRCHRCAQCLSFLFVCFVFCFQMHCKYQKNDAMCNICHLCHYSRTHILHSRNQQLVISNIQQSHTGHPNGIQVNLCHIFTNKIQQQLFTWSSLGLFWLYHLSHINIQQQTTSSVGRGNISLCLQRAFVRLHQFI